MGLTPVGRMCLRAWGCTGVPCIPVQAVPYMSIWTQWLHGHSLCSQFDNCVRAGTCPWTYTVCILGCSPLLTQMLDWEQRQLVIINMQSILLLNKMESVTSPSTSSDQRTNSLDCIHFENVKQSLKDACHNWSKSCVSQCSRVATRHGTCKLMEITEVVASTAVISCF